MYALQRMNGGKLRGEKPAIAILYAHILKQRTPCTSSRLQLEYHLQYNTKIFAKKYSVCIYIYNNNFNNNFT